MRFFATAILVPCLFLLSAKSAFGQTPLSGFKLPKFGNTESNPKPKQDGWLQLPPMFGPKKTERAENGNDAAKLFDTMPNLNPFRNQPYDANNEYSESTGPRPFAPFQEIFGNPEPAAEAEPKGPNLIDQLNTKSKNLVDRTTDWAHRKHEGFRQKTRNMWNGWGTVPPNSNAPMKNEKLSQPSTMPPGNSPPNGVTGNAARPNSFIPARPPIRSAANPNADHAMRF